MNIFDHFIDVSMSIVFGTIALGAIALISVRIALGLVCRAVLRDKGYPPQLNHGFLWGFFLGLIGLVVCMIKQPFFNGQGNMYGNGYYGNGYYGNGYGQPFGTQPGGWQCSCGAPNPPGSGFCRFCGNTRTQ